MGRGKTGWGVLAVWIRKGHGSGRVCAGVGRDGTNGGVRAVGEGAAFRGVGAGGWQCPPLRSRTGAANGQPPAGLRSGGAPLLAARAGRGRAMACGGPGRGRRRGCARRGSLQGDRSLGGADGAPVHQLSEGRGHGLLGAGEGGLHGVERVVGESKKGAGSGEAASAPAAQAPRCRWRLAAGAATRQRGRRGSRARAARRGGLGAQRRS